MKRFLQHMFSNLIEFITLPYDAILIIFVVFVILGFAYIKLKYPFWNLQPNLGAQHDHQRLL